MRVRKKKYIKERLLMCGEIVIDNAVNLAGKWREIFNNDKRLVLEIGCGKGGFITKTALKNADINFVAIEKIDDILVMAAERAKSLFILNIRFAVFDASNLDKLFCENEVSLIYINFCDPWLEGKKRKRRLTHSNYLEIYKKILTPKGEIHLKTDNKRLFDFSIFELQKSGFVLKNVSYDLHNSDYKDNIMTEYEEKFAEQGLNIYRLEAVNSGEWTVES